MASVAFKKTFIIRFMAYLFIFAGLSGIIFQFGPLIEAEINYRKDTLLGVKHALPSRIITSAGSIDEGASSFGEVGGREQIIKPVSTDYGIVIEKINANAAVVPNVDPTNEKDYSRALGKGVAEATGSTKPGENGNLFIFAHSADAPWNIARFNATFYLLRELAPGDKIIVFYNNRRYDYLVFDKTIARPDDVSFLANRYDKPVLTLQTCDPPGTLNNRLLVRAQLQGS